MEAAPAGWWKLVTLAGQSQRYAEDAAAVDATDPCLSARQPDPPQPGRTDPVVTAPDCAVCNATRPCLYDVLNDPTETANVASANPAVVARLAAALANASTYYVSGDLSADVMARYAPADNASWDGYLAPCYVPRATATIV